MRQSGDYKVLPEDEARYDIEVYRRSNLCKEGEVYAYYRGSLPLFKIYKDTPIRRQADGEIISVDYSKYPSIRGLAAFALFIAFMSPAATENPTVGILCGIGGVLLLGAALKLTQRSKACAIDSLKEQVRREINFREGAISNTGKLHEQGAQRVRPASSQPNITIVNSNTVLSPSDSQSPLNSPPPANYQATQAHVPPAAEEH